MRCAVIAEIALSRNRSQMEHSPSSIYAENITLIDNDCESGFSSISLSAYGSAKKCVIGYLLPALLIVLAIPLAPAMVPRNRLYGFRTTLIASFGYLKRLS